MNFFRSLWNWTFHGEDPDAVTVTPYQAADARNHPCGDDTWLKYGREQGVDLPDVIATPVENDADERLRAFRWGEVAAQIPDGRIEVKQPGEEEFEPIRERK